MYSLINKVCILYKLFQGAKLLIFIELRKFSALFFISNQHFVEKILGSRRNLFGRWGKWVYFCNVIQQ